MFNSRTEEGSSKSNFPPTRRQTERPTDGPPWQITVYIYASERFVIYDRTNYHFSFFNTFFFFFTRSRFPSIRYIEKRETRVVEVVIQKHWQDWTHCRAFKELLAYLRDFLVSNGLTGCLPDINLRPDILKISISQVPSLFKRYFLSEWTFWLVENSLPYPRAYCTSLKHFGWFGFIFSPFIFKQISSLTPLYTCFNLD